MLTEATLCLLVRGNPAQQVLLGYKKEGFGAGKITGFGGKVEPGETPAAAAIRELEEETGIRVSVDDLRAVGQLRFIFPNRPAWSQLVHVFLSHRWTGVPEEGREMRPDWYAVDQLPYEQMWQDSVYWLPRFLAGDRIRGRFRFEADNETVVDVMMELWGDASREALRA
jgi:8-oxo-dGTP pyrophosphatase MutT (NUDIX family)